jgi:hypothetical protein
MDRVKELRAAGLPLPDAIKHALREVGLSVTEFADQNELSRSVTSEVLNLDRRPRDGHLRALAKHLGGTAEQWAQLLWEAARPEVAA